MDNQQTLIFNLRSKTGRAQRCSCLRSCALVFWLAALFTCSVAEARKPPKQNPTAPSLGVAVDNSIHHLKVPAKAEYLDADKPVATTTPVFSTSSEPRLDEDGREAPPQKIHVKWKLDYPMPGELALGRWRSAESKALGAVATFPLPSLDAAN